MFPYQASGGGPPFNLLQGPAFEGPPGHPLQGFPSALLQGFPTSIFQGTPTPTFQAFQSPLLQGIPRHPHQGPPSNPFQNHPFGGLLNAAARGDLATEIDNYKVGDDAKLLLEDARNRLGLLSTYPKPQYAPIDINGVVKMLSDSLTALRRASAPLQVKNAMQNLNNQLILIVNNYFENMQTLVNGSAKADHSQMAAVLTELSTLIRQLSYKNVLGVFCVVYDETSEDYTTPVIHVTSTNFDPLLSVFRPAGFTTLKFKHNPGTYAFYDWFIETDSNRSPERVSFGRFNVSGSDRNDAGFVSPFTSACINEPATMYRWICIDCQTLVKVHSHTGQIKCHCGVGNAPTVNPECLKCARRLL